ncbi:SIMPL domain-containing protein [Janthinobacterium sp.]|uniref:SIMPL domain-containing protein n=1 Tax=Janthinobacterium sp. TaxID=1871054 RepID=UPI00293D709A|nr:SIMPL domain-containing protein [Janthinobacterium sp.]
MFRPCALALALLCVPAAAPASPLPDYPFVSASGKAELWLAPDIGELQFEVVIQHSDSEQALAQLNALSETLTTLFSEAGVAGADIGAADLGKKSVALSAKEDGGAPDAAYAYILTRHFSVRVRDLKAWPGFIGALLGRDHVDNVGVAFDRIDRDQVNDRLLQEAAQNARHTAADLALAFGRKPGAAVAIARTPLDKLGGAFGFGAVDGPGAAATPPAPGALNYAVPSAIKFTQAVHAVFKLK